MWYLITFVLAFAIGWKFREYYAMVVVSKLLSQIETETPQKENTIVYIEKHEDGLFVFEEATNKYLTNGKDLVEVNQKLKELYPAKLFVTKNKLEDFL